MNILKSYDEVERYLAEVQTCADAHKKEFGFLPQSAYQDQALQGKLWASGMKGIAQKNGSVP